MFDYLEQQPDWSSALDAYFDEYDDIDSGPAARGPEFFRLGDTTSRVWEVRQIIKDPEGDNSFQVFGVVDLDDSDKAGEVRLSHLEIQQS